MKLYMVFRELPVGYTCRLEAIALRGLLIWNLVIHIFTRSELLGIVAG